MISYLDSKDRELIFQQTAWTKTQNLHSASEN